MASIENRSRYTVIVKNRYDLTREFPFSKSKAIETHVAALREQGFKPKVTQAENLFLMRIVSQFFRALALIRERQGQS